MAISTAAFAGSNRDLARKRELNFFFWFYGFLIRFFPLPSAIVLLTVESVEPGAGRDLASPGF
jgi:hypothetical protein